MLPSQTSNIVKPRTEYQGPSVILLNGPPSSGKTSIRKALCNLDAGITYEQTAAPLKDAFVQLFYGGDYILADLDDPAFKEQSVPNFDFTVRKGLEDLGDSLRQTFGPAVFARTLASRLLGTLEIFECVVVDDIRFEEDFIEASRVIPIKDMLLIHVYRSEFSWDGYIGYYVSHPEMPTVDLYNNATIEEAVNTLLPHIFPTEVTENSDNE